MTALSLPLEATIWTLKSDWCCLCPHFKVLHADVQETACATPLQADILVPELQQQQPRAQPSIPNDIAASQAAPAYRALPKDQLNPSFHDPQQPSLVVVTPDQLFERPVCCDSHQARTLVTMIQPDSGLTDQVQTGTGPAFADDHSPATTPPAVSADSNAAAIPSNVLVDSTDGPGVSSISKTPGAAQISGSPATSVAAAAATATEQQSAPAEPTATVPVSPAHSNSNFGTSAVPTSSKLCAGVPTGIVALAEKPACSQGDLMPAVSSLLESLNCSLHQLLLPERFTHYKTGSHVVLTTMSS